MEGLWEMQERREERWVDRGRGREVDKGGEGWMMGAEQKL